MSEMYTEKEVELIKKIEVLIHSVNSLEKGNIEDHKEIKDNINAQWTQIDKNKHDLIVIKTTGNVKRTVWASVCGLAGAAMAGIVKYFIHNK